MKELVITSSIMIAAVVLLRWLFRGKVSQKLIYAAWLLVAARLLIPVQFGSFDFSLQSQTAPVTQIIDKVSKEPVSGPNREELYDEIIHDYIDQGEPIFIPDIQQQIDSALSSFPEREPEEIYDHYLQDYQQVILPEVQTKIEQAVDDSVNPLTIGQIAAIIWVTGMAGMAVWFAAVNISFGRRLRRSAVRLDYHQCPVRVWVSPLIASPCLFGLFRPSIYLTPQCEGNETQSRHVLTHELTHLKHRDHIWSLVRCVCLCVYWFNPLVWLAAYLSKRDCELACDEAALKTLGDEERIAYGKTLVDMVAASPSPVQLMETATAMHESKKQLKERVNRIAKNHKHILAAAICLVLIVALVTGCAFGGAANSPADPDTTEPSGTTEQTTVPTTTAPVTVEFPLEEEVTLVLTAAPRGTVMNLSQDLANNKLWNDLYERTNVNVEIKECPNVDTLSSLLKTGNYGDIILCYNSMKGMNETVLSGLIEQNKLLALNPYINNRELMPNLNSRVWDECPEAKGNFTSPDGNIYVLGSYGGDKSNYLENTCWVNKTWVEAAGMKIEDLSTLAGLEKFFAWVAENDANGNGDATDEVPYFNYQNGGYFIESLLGMWGIPTKDQSYEGYCYLEDGEVKFAPLTQNWVDFMTTMQKWTANGWTYEDYLLGHDGDGKPLYEYAWNNYVRDNGEPERIAFWTGTDAPARNTGSKMPEGTQMCEYVSILPPKVEGYETRWYINPGFMGQKGSFAIAANCKYPEIALAWMDQFYSLEVTIRNDYGEPDSGWYILDDDGKIVYYPYWDDPWIAERLDERLDQIIAAFPSAITEDDYKNVFSANGYTQKKRDTYAQYQDVINTEVWPRPYMTSSALSEHTALYTEISQIVAKYRNDWLSGKGDPNTDRDQFEAELKTAGVDRMVALMQEAYDVFRNAIG